MTPISADQLARTYRLMRGVQRSAEAHVRAAWPAAIEVKAGPVMVNGDTASTMVVTDGAAAPPSVLLRVGIM